MSGFRFTKPNPHDGRFDDIDDEDPMEGVEVPEHILHPKDDTKKTEDGARKTWPHGGDREHGLFGFFGGGSGEMTGLPDFKMFEGFVDRSHGSKSREPGSPNQSTSESRYDLRFFSGTAPSEDETSSTGLESDGLAKETPSESADDSRQFSSGGTDKPSKVQASNAGSKDWFSSIFGSKKSSDDPPPDDSVRSKYDFSSIFGPKKTSSQNFEVEKYEQPAKVEKIEPDQSSWMPTQFLMRLRRGKERSRRGYYRTVEPIPFDTPKPENHTRFVCVSDTHNEHDDIELPEGDVLLHCGDFTLAGRLHEVDDFNNWLGKVSYKHKIVIAGNHELSFDPKIMERVKIAKENKSYVRFGTYLKPIEESDWRDIRSRLSNCTYLEDNEVTINGIRIWGSPWQPEFGGWGFNVTRGKKILEKWDKIPDGIDILMTHGPPAGHGDKVIGGEPVGCVDLLNTIQLRVQPKYHLFGHIHESYGISTDKFTTYVNCSSVNYHYEPVHKPIIFDLPNKSEE